MHHRALARSTIPITARQGEAPQTPSVSMRETLLVMTEKRFGCVGVVGGDGTLAGIITDGDLRRLIETGADLRALTAADVMNPGPRTIRAEALGVEAAELMEHHRITSVLVTDAAQHLVGIVHVGDLMRAKVI